MLYSFSFSLCYQNIKLFVWTYEDYKSYHIIESSNFSKAPKLCFTPPCMNFNQLSIFVTICESTLTLIVIYIRKRNRTPGVFRQIATRSWPPVFPNLHYLIVFVMVFNSFSNEFRFSKPFIFYLYIVYSSAYIFVLSIYIFITHLHIYIWNCLFRNKSRIRYLICTPYCLYSDNKFNCNWD